MNISIYYKNRRAHTGKTSIALFYLLMVLSVKQSIAQLSMTVGGANWTVPISPITEAGANYPESYQSAADQIHISATVPPLLSGSRIAVQYQADPTWHPSLSIAARRTGTGQTLCLLCSVTGGTAYMPVTTVATELFRIQTLLTLTSFNNIPIQLRLSGASVTIPAASYRARVVFTISGL